MNSENPEMLRPVEFLTAGTWNRGDRRRGHFHRWAEKLNYITDGHSKLYGAAEVEAIVEDDDGFIHRVPVEKIRFLGPKRQIPSEYDEILTR